MAFPFAKQIKVLSSGFKVLTGTTLQSVLASADAALLGARATGIMSGGQITINSDTSKFNISAGTGQILDNSNPASPVYTPVTWSAMTGITPSVTGQNYLSITTAGALSQQSTDFTNSDIRLKLKLGRVAFTGGVVTVVQSEVVPLQGAVDQLADLAMGLGIFVETGCRIAPIGANLTFQLMGGKVYAHGQNFFNNPLDPHHSAIAGSAGAAKPYQYLNQTGVASGTNITAIDPTTYDLNGNTTAVPSAALTANATNQHVYLFPSGNVRAQRGQQVYTNLAAAVAAISTETFVLNPNVGTNGVLIAVISIARTCTSLQDTNTCTITATDRFGQILGGGGGSAAAPTSGDTTLVLSAQVSDNSSTATTLFSFQGVASTRYTINALLTGAGDSSNLGVMLGMSLPAGAISTMTFIGPVANDNVLLTGNANDSGNFAGRGNWINGNVKAMITVSISVTLGTTAGAVALQFMKSGSGTFTFFRPSTLTYRIA